MRSISWMIGLLGVCIAITGCTYSPGPWQGHLEQIEEYEPLLVVVEEEARLEVEPLEVAVQPQIQTQVQPKITPQPLPQQVTPPDIEPILETEPDQASATEARKSTAQPQPVVKSTPVEQKPPASDNDVISVIKSITKMDSNSTKRRLYVAIAKRDDLNDQAQIALVNAAFDTLFSETAMEDVLITMIQNPNFSTAGKEAILKRVEEFFSDSSKKRILSALPNE
jgi:hypothetical protein